MADAPGPVDEPTESLVKKEPELPAARSDREPLHQRHDACLRLAADVSTRLVALR